MLILLFVIFTLSVSFESIEEIKLDLLHSESLRTKVSELFGIYAGHQSDIYKFVDDLWKEILLRVSSFISGDKDSEKVEYFLMDKVGISLIPQYLISGYGLNEFISSKPSNFCSTVVSTKAGSYTILWPTENISPGDNIVCSNIQNKTVEQLAWATTLCYECFLSDAHNLADVCDKNVNVFLSSFPELHASVDVPSALNDLRRIFDDHCYTVNSISKRLRLNDFGSCFPCWELSSVKYRDLLLRRLEDKCTLDVDPLQDYLVTLFLLGIPIKIQLAIQLFELKLFSVLCAIGILFVKETLVKSLVQLTPVTHHDSLTDIIIATDFSHMTLQCNIDPVMYVGPDSLALLNSVEIDTEGGCGPRRAFDVFSGSGVQGIMLLRTSKAEHVTFIEKSNRAVRFLRFNAMLNALAPSCFLVAEGDVTDLRDMLPCTLCGSINLVVSNPPYIPTATSHESDLLSYGAGGLDGDDFVKATFTEIVPYLRDNSYSGNCFIFIVANLVNIDDYPRKIAKWTRNLSTFSPSARCKVFHGERWSSQVYAELIYNRNCSLADAASSSNYIKAVNYAQNLETLALSDVCNGLICYKSVPRCGGIDNVCIEIDVEVVHVDSQIWQVLALNSLESRALKLRVADFCNS